MIKILWVCKSPLFAQTLEPILNNNNISLEGICKEPNEAIELYEMTTADIVIMDMKWNYSVMSEIQLVQDFLEHNDKVKVILVTNSYEAHLKDRLKSIGVAGYFYKNTQPQNIADCITKVFTGQQYFISREKL